MINYINPLDLASKVMEGANLLKAGSLTDIAKASRIEPIVLIDETIVHLPYMSDVMQTLNSIFSGYWLQALEAVTGEVYGAQTLKILDQVNPNREGSLGVIAKQVYDRAGGLESYTLQLPRPDKVGSLEQYGIEDNSKILRETANLAVGKLFNVTFGQGDQKHTMPVTVRLIPAPTGSQTIVDILAINGKDDSIGERYHQWRAGSISLIGDLILGMDLIKEHRNALVRDTNGHYREILSRQRKNRLAAIATGKASIAAASNILITSSATVREFERKTAIRMSDAKARQRVFEDSYAILIAEIDASYEVVTIYHRDNASPSEYSVKELQAANRGNGGGGADIFKIFEAFKVGNVPAL